MTWIALGVAVLSLVVALVSLVGSIRAYRRAKAQLQRDLRVGWAPPEENHPIGPQEMP